MSDQLEQGLELTLDFAKLDAVAATGSQVVPVVLQHADSKDVLFLGYANDEALAATLDEGMAVLWSTSRNELWRKGATSGDVLSLVEVRVNCEQNSLLYLVRPTKGGVCHSKDLNGDTRRTCYYRSLSPSQQMSFVEGHQ